MSEVQVVRTITKTFEGVQTATDSDNTSSFTAPTGISLLPLS